MFVSIGLAAVKKYQLNVTTNHLDSSSFHFNGDYKVSEEQRNIEITYGSSLLPSTWFKTIYDEFNLYGGWRCASLNENGFGKLIRLKAIWGGDGWVKETIAVW